MVKIRYESGGDRSTPRSLGSYRKLYLTGVEGALGAIVQSENCIIKIRPRGRNI